MLTIKIPRLTTLAIALNSMLAQHLAASQNRTYGSSFSRCYSSAAAPLLHYPRGTY
jgi:hypothetical protein